ncbi:MAG: hypothetical protein ABIJ19_01585 [Patescibacteria group bacterium]
MKKIFLIIFLLFISSAPSIAMAVVQLETGLPNIPGGLLPTGQELPSYIRYLFIFGLGSITILALAQMMLGGIQYILSAGNVSKKEDAKDTIQQALLGLGLLLASFLLLRTINPDLVNLKNPTLTPLQFKSEAPTSPTGPNEPPQPGKPSVLIYSVMAPMACDSIGGQIFSPCKTHCLATPGSCSASMICCGKKP